MSLCTSFKSHYNTLTQKSHHFELNPHRSPKICMCQRYSGKIYNGIPTTIPPQRTAQYKSKRTKQKHSKEKITKERKTSLPSSNINHLIFFASPSLPDV